MLTVTDTSIVDNKSVTGAVLLPSSLGTFVRTQFLNNTSTDVSSLAEYTHGLVATKIGPLTHLFLQIKSGGAVTVVNVVRPVIATFENSTFHNNVATGVRIRLSSCSGQSNHCGLTHGLCLSFRLVVPTTSSLVVWQIQLVVTRIHRKIATMVVVSLLAALTPLITNACREPTGRVGTSRLVN